jgi:hypothetical protein
MTNPRRSNGLRGGRPPAVEVQLGVRVVLEERHVVRREQLDQLALSLQRH